MMKYTRKLSLVSMILVSVLVFTAVFNVALSSFGDFSLPGAVEQQANAQSKLQKSDIDMTAVREQYLKQQTVENTTASFDGLRWVIVELEGESLYDAFKKGSRFTDFSEYAASVEGRQVEANIKAIQSRFLEKLRRYNVDFTYKYSYTALNNGLALKVSAEGYNTISKLSGVKSVYCSERYAAPKYDAVQNSTNVYTTGIYDTSDLVEDAGNGKLKGYQGQGMAVAILDTGLDRAHEAFDPDEYAKLLEQFNVEESDLHYTKDDVANLINEKAADLHATKFGAGVNDLYYNLKVPFAYDYADDDVDVFPSYSSHGTHVAGIVAGKSDFDVTPNDKTDDETFVGVAPLAQLVICKVFTDDLFDQTLGGADGIDILAAIEDCALLGVDVINMSLGTSCGFSDEKTDEATNNAYNKIRELGISLVCAASNDYSSGFGGGNGTNLTSNPDSATVGAPSTYSSALSVASINGQKSKYIRGNGQDDQVAFITNSSDGNGNRLEFLEEVHKLLEKRYGQAAYDAALQNGQSAADALLRGGDVYTKDSLADLTLKYVLIGGVGRNSNYNATVRNQLTSRTLPDGTKVDGTIALVKRGDTTFEEKVQLAMDNGADACIIYNNVSGTINMSLGEVEDPIPTCLITMDAAVPFVETANADRYKTGYVDLKYEYQAGPFMSDFSSWGPVSDLTLKPEITAHGGEITSSVAGSGSYDVYSGTSMASPNMAGAVTILRQYVHEAFPELEGRALNARVFQMLMSTATIANNEEGQPYSPRKQGAGLADIANAIHSEGYITVRPNSKIYSETDPNTKDSIVDGYLDKTKLELLDDPDKNGVYTLTFTVNNLTKTPQTYTLTTYVMTETVASDNKTVAEKSYSLNSMCDIVYTGDAVQNGKVTVPASGQTEVTATVTLRREAKNYLDSNFANGMYVEGFVSLANDDPNGVTLGLPYLAFYGDWTDAPLFDYDVYELAESEKDTDVDPEDKLKATAAATEVIGMYHNDEYILPLGSYLYEMEESEDDIYPERDKIALSMYDEEGNYTVYELYAVYAGLLRNAAYMDAVFTNAATGEVLYEEQMENIGKSYAAGGANRGAFVRFEINPSEWGLKNNDTYNVTLNGRLDYGGYVPSGQGRNSFEFPITIDYEAPQILDYNIRFDSYKENGETKYRVYLDLNVYDNQYVMAVLPCYLKEYTQGRVGTYLTLLTEYPVPVYGQKGATTPVSIEITDYYEQYGLTGDLYIQIEDYAMNAEVYNISLDEDSLDYPTEEVNFISDKKLTRRVDSDGEKVYGYNRDEGRTPYPIYDLQLTPYELYKLNTTNDLSVFRTLTWRGESDIVKAHEGEIYGIAMSEKTTSLQLVDLFDESSEELGIGEHRIYAQIDVQVINGRPGRKPSPDALYFKPVVVGNYNVMDPNNGATLEVNPNSEIALEPYITPWYFEAAYEYENKKKFEFTWTTSSETTLTVASDRKEGTDGTIIIGSTGTVNTLKRGAATVTATAAESQYSFLRKVISFKVGDEFYVNNFTLYDYYGGPEVEIPSDLNVMYINEDCFKNNKYITSVVLPPTLQEIPHYAFQNCVNLTEITIPSQCVVVGVGAFNGCTSLSTVNFAEYVDANKKPVEGAVGSIMIGDFAFAGTAIKNFNTPGRMTTMRDGAFADCDELETIDISELRSVGANVFANCDNLSTVITSESTSLGEGMFQGCTSLKEFEFKGSKIPANAFNGCTQLATFTISSDNLLEIGDYALAYTAIGSITLPAGSYTIGEGAFANCINLSEVHFKAGARAQYAGADPFKACAGLKTYAIDGEDEAYIIDSDGAMYTADRQTLVSVPVGKTDYSLPETVTKIGDGALSGSAIKELDLSHVEEIGNYAFAESQLTSVTLPENCESLPTGAFYGCAELATVNNLENVKSVGDYAFAGCKSLASIELPQATTIGDYAFFFVRGSSSAFTVPSGDENVFASITAPNVESVGECAFMGAMLTNVNMPNLKKIGAWAFACEKALGSVSVGAIEEMGTHAFFNSAALKTVSFGAGTKVVGEYAFSTYDEYYDAPYMLYLSGAYESAIAAGLRPYAPTRRNISTSSILIQVQLPASVTRIGAYAFMGQAGLTNVDLSGATDIGAYAFYQCGSLTNITNLGSALSIGDYAFSGAALTTVSLPKATSIGNYAFAGGAETPSRWFANDEGIVAPNSLYARSKDVSGGSLTSVTLGAAQHIGSYAFAGNQLTEVTLPASMSARTYQFKEDILNKKGYVERSRQRIVEAYGVGAFAYNSSLTSINVAGNDSPFVSIDGVLYSKVENGYQLEQYPGGKRATSYSIAEGTVAIGDGAFEGSANTDEVVLPYTVKTIGSYAFYSSTVKHYVFNSVQAPTLIAAYDPYALELLKAIVSYSIYVQEGHYPWEIDTDGEMYLNLENITISSYYSNFNDYVWLNGYGQIFFIPFEIESEDVHDFSMTFPKNGRGYDSALWSAYCSRVTYTAENLPDDTTHEVISAMQAMKENVTIEMINSAGEREDASALALDGAIANYVKAARAKYNLVTAQDQKQLLEEDYATLLEYEKALRDARKKAKVQVTLQSVSRESAPSKRRYNVGETFDPTGLTIRVVYSDTSELLLDGNDPQLSYDKTVINAGDTKVLVTYTDLYTGQTQVIELLINVNGGGSSTPVDPTDPSGGGSGSKGGLQDWHYGLMAVGVLIILAIVVFIVVLTKQRGGKGGSDGDVTPAEADNDSDGDETPAEEYDDADEENQEDENSGEDIQEYADEEDLEENESVSNDEAHEEEPLSEQETAEDEETYYDVTEEQGEETPLESEEPQAEPLENEEPESTGPEAEPLAEEQEEVTAEPVEPEYEPAKQAEAEPAYEATRPAEEPARPAEEPARPVEAGSRPVVGKAAHGVDEGSTVNYKRAGRKPVFDLGDED